MADYEVSPQISADEILRTKIKFEEKAARDWYSIMLDAYEDGFREGFEQSFMKNFKGESEESREKMQLALAKEMLKRGNTPYMVADCAKLSEKKVWLISDEIARMQQLSFAKVHEITDEEILREKVKFEEKTERDRCIVMLHAKEEGKDREKVEKVKRLLRTGLDPVLVIKISGLGMNAIELILNEMSMTE